MCYSAEILSQYACPEWLITKRLGFTISIIESVLSISNQDSVKMNGIRLLILKGSSTEFLNPDSICLENRYMLQVFRI